MRHLLLIALLCAVASGPSPARGEEAAKAMKVRVADGNVATIMVTDAGVLPAQDDVFRVESAGVGLQRSPGPGAPPSLRWVFGVALKSEAPLATISVEEVFPAGAPKPYVREASPTVKDRKWTALSPAVDITPANTPWLFKDDSTLFIFKFTLARAGQPPAVLYQASTFAPATKRNLLARVQ